MVHFSVSLQRNLFRSSGMNVKNAWEMMVINSKRNG